MSDNRRLLVLTLGMCAIFGLQGYLQELILQHTFQNRFAFFVTALQCGTLAALAVAQLAAAPAPPKSAAPTPRRFYLLLSVLQGCGLALTNRAVQSLNYPTKVVFKSSKPAMVMLYSALLLRKSYGARDYCAVLAMVVGLALFVLGDTQATPKYDSLGVPLVTLALVLDALIGPVQEYCLRSFGTPKAALVGYAYMGGFAINLGVATVSGDLGGAYGFLLQAETLQGQLTPVVLVVLLATISFFGVSLIVSIVEEFGAVVANLAATARKGLTLAVSFLFFPKPLTLTHAGGMLLFFVGLVWNSHLRHQEKERHRAAKEGGTAAKKRD